MIFSFKSALVLINWCNSDGCQYCDIHLHKALNSRAGIIDFCLIEATPLKSAEVVEFCQLNAITVETLLKKKGQTARTGGKTSQALAI